MSTGEITDPNLEGLSEEAFQEPGEGGYTPEQLTARIKLKREQAEQDAGWTVPPGLGPDVEPLPEQTTTEEEPVEKPVEKPEEEEQADDDEALPPPDVSEEEGEQEADAEDFYVGRYRDRSAAE